jgi:hypothetical protein
LYRLLEKYDCNQRKNLTNKPQIKKKERKLPIERVHKNSSLYLLLHCTLLTFFLFNQKETGRMAVKDGASGQRTIESVLFFLIVVGVCICALCLMLCATRFFFFFFLSNFLQRSGRVYKYWSAALCGTHSKGRASLEKTPKEEKRQKNQTADCWDLKRDARTRGHFDESTAQQTKKTKVPFDFGSRLSLAGQRHHNLHHPPPSTCSILFGCCAGRCYSHPNSGGWPYMMEECFPFSLCAQTARNAGKKAPLFTLGNRHTHRERPKEKGASFK